MGRGHRRGIGRLSAVTTAAWNSWDVLANPAGLLFDTASHFRHPVTNASAFVFSALFALCLAAMYFMRVAIIEFQQEESGPAHGLTTAGALPTRVSVTRWGHDRLATLRAVRPHSQAHDALNAGLWFVNPCVL